MTKFYVHYVHDSSPLLKEFKTLKAAKAFASKFKKTGKPDDGYWVDFIVAGRIVEADEYYEEQLS